MAMMMRKDHFLNVRLRWTSRVLVTAWVGGGLVFGLLAVTVHVLFLIPLVLLLAVIGVWSMRLRCARCEHPIQKHYLEAGGMRLAYWAPWIPKYCHRCHARIP